MLARVQSYVLQGIDALPCEVEIDFDIGASPGAGGPGEEQKQRTTTVGLPDTAVKESIERVRSAMGNSGYPPQNGKVLINLAPADIRKEGPLYDLPIAVGLLLAQRAVGTGRGDMSPVVRSAKTKRGVGTGAGVAASGGREKAKPFDPFAIEEDEPHAPAEPLDYRQFLFAGELALDGRLRPIRGVIAMAALAKAKGFRGVVVPAENAAEAAMVPGVESIGIATLSELVGILNGDLPAQMHPPADIAALLGAATATVDFVEVRGQEAVKRAITVACAGAHNLLQRGPSGGYGWSVHRSACSAECFVRFIFQSLLRRIAAPSESHRLWIVIWGAGHMWGVSDVITLYLSIPTAEPRTSGLGKHATRFGCGSVACLGGIRPS